MNRSRKKYYFDIEQAYFAFSDSRKSMAVNVTYFSSPETRLKSSMSRIFEYTHSINGNTVLTDCLRRLTTYQTWLCNLCNETALSKIDSSVGKRSVTCRFDSEGKRQL